MLVVRGRGRPHKPPAPVVPDIAAVRWIVTVDTDGHEHAWHPDDLYAAHPELFTPAFATGKDAP